MKKGLRLPSPSFVISLIALFLALGGTAMAAAGVNPVRIVDPKTPKHVARVDARGRLEVGDGTGPLTVDGNVTVANGSAPLAVAGNVKVDNGSSPLTVTGNVTGNVKVANGSAPLTVNGTVNAQAAPPSSYLHAAAVGLTSGFGCVNVAQPPAGMAMVVREARINVFADPGPGIGQTVEIFGDPLCTDLVADVNPATVGQTTVPFDPGLSIPAGGAVSALASGAVEAEVYTDAFAVPSSAVPAVKISRGTAHRPRQ